MTVELVTGFAGTPHINSSDVGAYNAGLVGPGDYALATGGQLKATMSNATTFALQSGDAVLNGRHVHLTGTTTATVGAGVAGQKRNDIAALRYTRDTTTNIETVQLVIIKGNATTGTPADPILNKSLITDGVRTHDMPLYRIPLDGITPGTLVPLFNVLKPMADVWDSLTHNTARDWRQTINGWDVRLTNVMGRIYNLRATKTFQSSTGMQNHSVPGLPVTIKEIQGIPACIQVGSGIVNYAHASIAGNTLSVLSPGYGNAHTIAANGLICAD